MPNPMQTKLTTAETNGRWIVFQPDADISDFDSDKLTFWVFEGKPPTTGSLIRVNDVISTMNLTRDATGAYNSTAYYLAYNLAFAKEHLTKIMRDERECVPMGDALIDDLPPAVLSAYVADADTTRGVTGADLSALKKPKPSDGGSGSESGS